MKKLKLNKQIVSKLNDVKGGAHNTRTCPIVDYSQKPEPTKPTTKGILGASCDCYTEPTYCSQAPTCTTLHDSCTSWVNC